MEGMTDVEKQIKEIMERNSISYSEMSSIVNRVRIQLANEGKDTTSNEEIRMYKEFKEKGNVGLETEIEGGVWTHVFSYGIETLRCIFGDVDFSRPFRMTIDYNPEQPRTIVRKYLTKKDYESYNALIQEKMKD